MMRRRQRILILMGVVLAGLAGPLMMGMNTYATNEEEIVKKWAFVGYRQCVNGEKINLTLKTKGQSGKVAEKVMKKQGEVNLPSYRFMHSANDSINCYDLFMGNSGFKGVLDYVGGNSKTVTWTDGAETKKLLSDKLGYNFQGKGKEYFTIIANRTDCTTPNVIGGGTSCSDKTSTSVKVVSNGNGKYSVEDSFENKFFKDIKVETNKKSLVIRLNPGLGCDSHGSPVKVPFQDDTKKFGAEVTKALNGITWNESCTTEAATNVTTFKFSTNAVSAGQDGVYDYPKGNQETLNNAIKAMSGQGLSGLGLNTSERYTLYTYYLNAAAKGQGGSVNCDSDDSEESSNLTKVKHIKSEGKFKTCEVSFNGENPDKIKVYDIREKSGKPAITKIKISTVIKWLDNVDVSKLKDVKDVEGIENIRAVDSSEPEAEDDNTEATCLNSSAAFTLGWILCPGIDILEGASKSLYTEYVEPALQVDPKLFTFGENKGDSAVRNGWEIFRGFANVVFIILFLVVIFSQLTGYGIDNYGIKKILPKLIVAAILINLSYWICIAFVDISNIVGNSLQALFKNMADAIKIPDDIGGLGVGGFAAGTITAVAILGYLVQHVWSAFTGAGLTGVLVMVLISAISIVIGLLFLFLLFAAREAIIVVLTIVSPIMIVCYMLPNTKPIFDKWLNVGKALLLVYPICGLLIGGGNFVSNILLAAGAGSGDLFSSFVAMAVGIVPIFFIPTVLKNSFKALGNVGARLSGLGKEISGRVSGGAGEAMRGSERYKNAQQSAMERRVAWQAGIDANGNMKQISRFGRAIRGGDRSVQRSRAQYRKIMGDAGNLERYGDDAAYRALLKGDEDNRLYQDEMARITASGEVNDIDGMTDGLRQALVDNNTVKIRAYTDALSTKGENGRSAVKKAWNTAVAGGISVDAANTFGNNILNNHTPEYKNDARSLYEVAKLASGATGDNAQDKIVSSDDKNHISPESLAANAKSSTMVSMDDEEFDQTFGDYVNNTEGAWDDLDGDTKHSIQYRAYQALQNNQNIKGERLQKLSTLAQGYTPRDGETLQVQQNNNTVSPDSASVNASTTTSETVTSNSGTVTADSGASQNGNSDNGATTSTSSNTARVIPNNGTTANDSTTLQVHQNGGSNTVEVSLPQGGNGRNSSGRPSRLITDARGVDLREERRRQQGGR